MAFASRVPRMEGTDLRVRPLPLSHRSWGRGEWHSPYVYRDQERQTYVSARFLHSSHLSVGQGRMTFASRVPRPREADLRVRRPPLSSIVRGAGANGIRFTCAKTRRGRSTCPPASLFYRSRGRGEWHSPYVYRGRNGIRTATDATERGSPTGLFFGISPSARGCMFHLMESLNPFWRHPYYLNWNQSL